ncbi:MAG: hypothetical protein AAF802_26485 [Planctomycetota bacterium]
MDFKVNGGCLAEVIALGKIESATNQMVDEFRGHAIDLLATFLDGLPNAENTNHLENDLFERLRELGRRLIAWCFDQVEPEDVQGMPGTVSHRARHRVASR